MADIAVITPVFGRDDVFTTIGFLRKTAEANRFFFIVIDNGNAPELSARLKTLSASDCRVVRLESNRGGSGAYRIGMQAALEDAGTEYLWLLDDDAMPNERTLPEMLNVFCREEAMPSGRKPVGVVGGTMLGKNYPTRITEVGCFVSRWTGCIIQRFTFKDIADVGDRTDEVDYCAAASFLTRREVVEKVGVFGDMFIHWDDIDWCFRVREAGYRVLTTTRSTVNHPEDTGKASEWVVYYDVRNSLRFMDAHMPIWTRLRVRWNVVFGRLWCIYHGKYATIRMVDLGRRHAKSGELLMRNELPLTPSPRSIAEIVKDADFVGVLARPKELGDAMAATLAETGIRNVQVIICRRPGMNKVWKYVLAFSAQIRMQFSIWRARHPVVFQDSFCISRYPLRIFGAEKHFFAASGGKAEVLPS